MTKSTTIFKGLMFHSSPFPHVREPRCVCLLRAVCGLVRWRRLQVLKSDNCSRVLQINRKGVFPFVSQRSGYSEKHAKPCFFRTRSAKPRNVACMFLPIGFQQEDGDLRPRGCSCVGCRVFPSPLSVAPVVRVRFRGRVGVDVGLQ